MTEHHEEHQSFQVRGANRQSDRRQSGKSAGQRPITKLQMILETAPLSDADDRDPAETLGTGPSAGRSGITKLANGVVNSPASLFLIGLAAGVIYFTSA